MEKDVIAESIIDIIDSYKYLFIEAEQYASHHEEYSVLHFIKRYFEQFDFLFRTMQMEKILNFGQKDLESYLAAAHFLKKLNLFISEISKNPKNIEFLNNNFNFQQFLRQVEKLIEVYEKHEYSQHPGQLSKELLKKYSSISDYLQAEKKVIIKCDDLDCMLEEIDGQIFVSIPYAHYTEGVKKFIEMSKILQLDEVDVNLKFLANLIRQLDNSFMKLIKQLRKYLGQEAFLVETNELVKLYEKVWKEDLDNLERNNKFRQLQKNFIRKIFEAIKFNIALMTGISIYTKGTADEIINDTGTLHIDDPKGFERIILFRKIDFVRQYLSLMQKFLRNIELHSRSKEIIESCPAFKEFLSNLEAVICFYNRAPEKIKKAIGEDNFEEDLITLYRRVKASELNRDLTFETEIHFLKNYFSESIKVIKESVNKIKRDQVSNLRHEILMLNREFASEIRNLRKKYGFRKVIVIEAELKKIALELKNLQTELTMGRLRYIAKLLHGLDFMKQSNYNKEKQKCLIEYQRKFKKLLNANKLSELSELLENYRKKSRDLAKKYGVNDKSLFSEEPSLEDVVEEDIEQQDIDEDNDAVNSLYEEEQPVDENEVQEHSTDMIPNKIVEFEVLPQGQTPENPDFDGFTRVLWTNLGIKFAKLGARQVVKQHKRHIIKWSSRVLYRQTLKKTVEAGEKTVGKRLLQQSSKVTTRVPIAIVIFVTVLPPLIMLSNYKSNQERFAKMNMVRPLSPSEVKDFLLQQRELEKYYALGKLHELDISQISNTKKEDQRKLYKAILSGKKSLAFEQTTQESKKPMQSVGMFLDNEDPFAVFDEVLGPVETLPKNLTLQQVQDKRSKQDILAQTDYIFVFKK